MTNADSSQTEPQPLRDSLAMERTRLANERTLLAYVRTAIMILATGATLLKLYSNPSLPWILGLVLTALGIWLGLFGGSRFVKLGRSLDLRR